MSGIRIETLNRMLVAVVISAVAVVGMNLPASAQHQQKDQQDKQKQEKQKQTKEEKRVPPAREPAQQERAQQKQEQPAAQQQQRAERHQQEQAAQEQQRAQRQQQQDKAAQQQQRAERHQQQVGQQQQAAQVQQRAQRRQQEEAAQQQQQQRRTTANAARVGQQQQEQRVSQQRQQLKTQQQQRLVQYRQQVQMQDHFWTQRSALLQRQRRMAQYRFQQAYLERRRQQMQDWNARSYDYDSDPNFYSAANYRYSRGGRYYQTNQYGADLLRQAVNYGYEQGFQAGQADREDRWRAASYQSSYAYQDANYGYNGYYLAQTEYNYYFRQGFRRGYEDGYNSRSQYGSYSNGNNSIILAVVLSQILNLANF